MTHLELENLASEYLEGQMDSALHAQVEEHLAGCGPCQELLSDVRAAIQLCKSGGEVMPPPWLVPKIRHATIGEVQVGFAEQVSSLFRNVRQPRIAYAVAMTVFSLSLIVNIAGVNVRSLNIRNLNPTTLFYRVNRAGHLLYARAEKFYDDLRIVYEIESRFRNAQGKSGDDEKQTSKPNLSPGRPASTAESGKEQLAYTRVYGAGQHTQLEQGVQTDELR